VFGAPFVRRFQLLTEEPISAPYLHRTRCLTGNKKWENCKSLSDNDLQPRLFCCCVHNEDIDPSNRVGVIGRRM
jgi:hypothetical protein